MKSIDRIFEYLEEKGETPYSFEKRIGLSNGYLSTTKKRSGGLGEDLLNQVLDKCKEINPIWLLTGKGNMWLSQKDRSKVDKTTINASKKFQLRTDVDVDEQSIPLYNIEAAAGIVQLFKHKNDEQPIDHLRIPGIPKSDGAIYITGDSMYPLLKSGDIVIYKEFNDYLNNVFIWGEMYVIAFALEDDQMVTVKYIHKSEVGDEHVKLVSANGHHQPIDIKKKSIKALALIKASVRINSMG